MPVPCAFFFSAEFFSAPCTDAGRMLPGAGRWEFGPRGEGAGAPGRKSGTKVRLGSPGQGCGTESGALFPEFGTEAPGRDSGRSCEGRVPEQGSACRIGPSEAGAGRRFLHRGIGCSPGEGAGAPGRDSESLPEDRLRVLRFRGRVRAPRPVPWTVPGVAAVSVVRGPRLIPGPGSGNRAGVRAPRRFPRPGFVVRGRVPWTVPGGMRRKAFSGLGPGRLPKAFRLRRIFPRTEAFSAAHERRRGNPRSAFPSGGGPGSAGSRFPGAGSGCGRFLRRPHPAAENRGNPASPVKKETFQTGFVEKL